MSELLEAYTYENFKEHMKTWLKTGRIVVSVAGNVDEAQAVKMAEKAIGGLSLTPVPVDKLPYNQITRLKEGKTVTFEEPVHDPKNDNSGVYVVYQDDFAESVLPTRSYWLVDVVAKFLEQAFFDDLRTKQQLGYVVSSGVSGTDYIPEIVFKV